MNITNQTSFISYFVSQSTVEPCDRPRSRWISDHYQPHPQRVLQSRVSGISCVLYNFENLCPHNNRNALIFSRPAGENTSFYRLLIMRFMDNWETSPNVRLALLCLCAVKTFFELPFHIIYWHPVARLHPDLTMFLAARSKVHTGRSQCSL